MPKNFTQLHRLAGSLVSEISPPASERVVQKTMKFMNRFTTMPPALTKRWTFFMQHLRADVNGKTVTRPG